MMAAVSLPNPSQAASDSPSATNTRLAAHEFPHQRDGIYLNHAASAPMPTRTSRALRAYADDRERLFALYQTGTQDYDLAVLQRKLATLLDAPADRLTFVPTTTDAIAGTINSIDWRAGDNIVVPDNEYPGVLYPCLHLASRGVEARLVPVDVEAGAHADLDRVLSAIDRRTRAVAISHVHWQTGHRLDLDRLGAECRARGVMSIVDAIQSVGGVPVNVAKADVDVLTAGAYKWMMAMPGTAVLYVSPQFLEHAVPDRAGYKGMAAGPTAVVAGPPRIQWAEGAGRFQVGGTINAALVALEHSVDLLLEIGVPAIFAHVSTLIDHLAANAARAGLQLKSDLRAPHRSTFANVSTGNADCDERLVKALVAERVIVGVRGPGIRVAPHLHNSIEDIDRFLTLVKDLA
jgi:cysteine desulfurase / selenocysteine lyase